MKYVDATVYVNTKNSIIKARIIKYIKKDSNGKDVNYYLLTSLMKKIFCFYQIFIGEDGRLKLILEK